MCFNLTKSFLAFAAIGFLSSCGFVGTSLPEVKETPLNLSLVAPSSSTFQVGVAATAITPELNRQPVWMAGYNTGRRASSVHDPLWARALWISDGSNRLAWVALDLIGYPLLEVQKIRTLVQAKHLPVDYVWVASTHTHSGPDTLGLWGWFQIFSGLNPDYLVQVNQTVVDAIDAAQQRAVPAELSAVTFSTEPEGFIRDGHEPTVIDFACTALRFHQSSTNTEIATVVIWSNHPEILGGNNTALSSDYPHAIRETIEKNFNGTTALFFAGMVGGLSPLHLDVRDDAGTVLTEGSYEKMTQVGNVIGSRVVQELRRVESEATAQVAMTIRAKTIDIPVHNQLMLWLAQMGVLNRGITPDQKIRTEVALIRLGDVWLLSVPGELFPELFLGGIEPLPESEFPNASAESPPLQTQMQGRINAVIGLANDEIGYIIPKQEWLPVNAFGDSAGTSAGYQLESNSVGPEAAPTLHEVIISILQEASPP